MDKQTLMWIIIGVLFLAVLFMTFKASGSGVSSTAGATKGASSAVYSSMVGGC